MGGGRWRAVDIERVGLFIVLSDRQMSPLVDRNVGGRIVEGEGGIAEEFADVFSYLLELANRFGVDLEEAYRKKRKNAVRMNAAFCLQINR